MNAWLWAALAMIVGLFPCAWVCFRGEVMESLVALEFAGTLEVLILVLLAQGFGRSSFYDIALAMAFLAFGGGMVFARFFERWL